MVKKKKKKEFTFYWEEPFEEVKRTKKEMEKMLKTFWVEPFKLEFTIPKIKIPRILSEAMKESDKEIVLRIPLPGFKKDEVKLKVSNDSVYIKAEKKKMEKRKCSSDFFSSLEESRIERSFRLPVSVDPERTKARMEDGVLTVILAKVKPKKKEKDVKIE
ncbi:MAG: Hsp20/alpha crystallin family protein [Candidatus Aenigmarchaeota archaeon]|nr:Hsp20/alpha crystallin family protein [Candidatus Aenigmarchaeota archaeon]